MAQGTKSFASTRLHLESLPKEAGRSDALLESPPELTEPGEYLG